MELKETLKKVASAFRRTNAPPLPEASRRMTTFNEKAKEAGQRIQAEKEPQGRTE